MHKRNSLTTSASISPNKSPLRSLPETHIIQDRYKCYDRAADYIKHLTKIYNTQVANSGVYDQAYYNSYKFRVQEPKDQAKFKVSQFPKAKINQELLEQQEIFNAYNQISSERPKHRSRPKSTVPQSHSRSNTEKNSFSYKQVKLSVSDKCENCHKIVCKCNKPVIDEFLQAILTKQKKNLEKINQGSVGEKLKAKKSEIIKNRNSFRVRASTFDDNSEKVFAAKRKSANFQKKSPLKDNELSPGCTFDHSLSISPVNMFYRK